MQRICGVDACKAWLDAWLASHFKRFANTPEGVEELFAFCREHDAELVVMEGSGGVEQAAYLALWKLGQPCAIANARAVRSFADAMGYLEKTDRIDAEMIAGYAAAKKLVAMLPPSDDQRRLTALAARLRQISADLSVQKQRLHSTVDPTALASLKQAVAFFTPSGRGTRRRDRRADQGRSGLGRPRRNHPVGQRPRRSNRRRPARRSARTRYHLEQGDHQARRPRPPRR